MAKLIASYQLANSANYSFDITKIGYHAYDEAAYYHKENFPDLKITRPNTVTDMQLLHDRFLITINGFVYPTEYVDNTLYVPKATVNMLHSRLNSVGLINIGRLSENIVKHVITPAMVTSEANIPAFEKIYITSPVALVKPVLVMAGYLVFENPEYFYRVSDFTFVLRLDRLAYIDKLYELSRYRSIFQELEVPVSSDNMTLVDAELVRSELTIKRFMSLHNSFLVDLNIDNLSVSKIYLEHSTVPCNFWTETRPILPLIVGKGKLGEYQKERAVGNKYTVLTQDAYYNNHLLSALPPQDINVYNAHRRVGSTYRLSPAFFLEISTQT
jgi:hypothetical protein